MSYWKSYHECRRDKQLYIRLSIAQKINANISSLTKMIEERPKIEDIIVNKIAVYKERLTLYKNPEPKRETAVVKMQIYVVQLENNLSEN